MTEHPERHLRRKEAAAYVVETHNVPCSQQTLAKLACVGSDGPIFRMAGRFPLYPVSGLDAWAYKKIGPLVRSTSEAKAVKHDFGLHCMALLRETNLNPGSKDQSSN